MNPRVKLGLIIAAVLAAVATVVGVATADGDGDGDNGGAAVLHTRIAGDLAGSLHSAIS